MFETEGGFGYILKLIKRLAQFGRQDSSLLNTFTGTVQVCLEESEGVPVNLAHVKLEPEDNTPACRMAVFVVTHHLHGKHETIRVFLGGGAVTLLESNTVPECISQKNMQLKGIKMELIFLPHHDVPPEQLSRLQHKIKPFRLSPAHVAATCKQHLVELWHREFWKTTMSFW